MKYQLVLQFPKNSITDYDELVTIENELSKTLGTSAEVDGHDCGLGEMNIFIHADEPEQIFEMIRLVVAKKRMYENLVAAYRELTGEDYTVVWPIGFAKPFRIA